MTKINGASLGRPSPCSGMTMAEMMMIILMECKRPNELVEHFLFECMEYDYEKNKDIRRVTVYFTKSDYLQN